MRSRILAIAAIVALVIYVGPSARVNAQPATPTIFSLVAEGDGLNVVVNYPGALPVVQSVSASPWGASASLDSLGDSSATAGSPYSPFVYSLPGTVAGLGAGQLPPLPTLPGEITSSYPTTPASSQTTGPYMLSASSSASDSKSSVSIGSAVQGGPAAPVSANAETLVNDDGSVSATATAGVDALNLGGIIDIANVSSTETIVEAASGNPTYRDTTNLGTVTIQGVTAGLIGNNINLGNSSVTDPLTPALLPVLNTVLQPAGISFAFLPQTFVYTDGTSSTGSSPDPSKRLQTVDSGAMSVTFTHSIPGQGTPTVTLTLGRVYVSAQDTAFPVIPLPSASEESTLGQTTGTFATPFLPPPMATASPISPIAQRGTTVANRPTPRTVLSRTAEVLYLILMLGALAALGGSRVIRLFGIRLGSHRRSVT